MIDIQQIVHHVQPENVQSESDRGSDHRVELSGENAAAGLGQLAVSLINLLHELMERQAIRRMDNGTISDKQAENLGMALMRQSEAIDELCDSFGISRDDLQIDLGPLGKLV